MSDDPENPPAPLTGAKLEEVRDHFEFCDTDGNGHIDFDEFADLLKILSPESTTAQAAAGFSITDTNSDGYIDFEEFIAWWQTTWWEY